MEKMRSGKKPQTGYSRAGRECIFRRIGLFQSQPWGPMGSAVVSRGFQQDLPHGCSERVATRQLAFSCAVEELNGWAERLGCPLVHR